MKKVILKKISIILTTIIVMGMCFGCGGVQPENTADATADDIESLEEESSAFGLKDFEGFYYQTVTEEFDGFELISIYGYQFNGDGTGTCYGQDVIDITWNETEIHSGGNVVNYQMEPGKLTVHDEVVGDIIYNKLSGNFVKPNSHAVDMDAIEDGIYPVDIYQDGVSMMDDVLSITAEIYTEETYDIAEIGQLAPGDILFINGMLYEINTVETSQYGSLEINGGLEEGGTSLRPHEESNCYMYFGMDDECSYSRQGIATIPVSAEVKLTDSSDLSGEKVYSGEEVKAALDLILSDDFLSRYNCRIRVENGSIVEISKMYRP